MLPDAARDADAVLGGQPVCFTASGDTVICEQLFEQLHDTGIPAHLCRVCGHKMGSPTTDRRKQGANDLAKSLEHVLN